MPADAAASSPSVSDHQQQIEVLKAELRARVSEQAALTAQLADQNSAYSERQVHQVATNEVLAAMAVSPTDPQPVFDLIATRARDICGSYGVSVMEFDGAMVRLRAWTGVSDDSAVRDAYVALFPMLPDRTRVEGRAILDGQVVHVRDYQSEREVRVSAGNTTVKSNVAVPMKRGTDVIGVVVMGSRDVGGFSDSQVELLKTFAEQAVIAITSAAAHREQREALEQQTATAEILRVISQSPTDVQPVLTSVAKAALRFCGAEDVGIFLREGEQYLMAAHEGPMIPEVGVRYPLSRQTAPGQAMLDNRTAHFPDIGALDSVEYAAAREFSLRHGFKAAIAAPMLREGTAIGAVTLRRSRAGAFTPRQIALLESFAAQAVIALENTRLFTELQQRTDDLTESLEYQTATSEVLEVIGRSTSDIQPVLDTMLSAALRLCSTESGGIAIQQEKGFRYVATLGWDSEADKVFRSLDIGPGRGTVASRVLAEGRIVQVADVASDPDFALPDMAERAQWRAALGVPLMRDNRPIGVIAITRDRVEPFTERQISLVKTFADQAVIAMENARLLGELRERTNDLTESLEYQTATSELLEVISRSTSDIQPVLDAMLAAAARLCGTHFGTIAVRQGDVFRRLAILGYAPEVERALRSEPVRPGRNSVSGRVLQAKQVVQVPDLAADPDFAVPVLQFDNLRTTLGVPMLRDGEPIGVIAVSRNRVEPFTERQIGLIQTFADQAVIAMENARLLGELRESLDRQTATAEVLQVINSSPGDVQPVFDEILAKAMTLCDAAFGTFSTFDGERLRTVANHGVPEAFARYRRANPPDYGPGTGPGRLIAGEDCVHDIDAADSDSYRRGDPNRRAIVDLGGARTILNVALRKDGVLLGAMSIYRQEVQPFSDSQIALLQGFAAQAVIAMENARLLGELRESLDQQTATSDVLSTISRSSVDLSTVLNTLAETVARLCRADHAYMFRRQEGLHHLVASHGVSDETKEYMLANPFTPDRGNTSGRVLIERRTVHIPDVLADPEYTYREGQKIAGFRTMLGIPLMREVAVLGVFVASRTRVEPFSDKEIALATGFADQAVIAIENARLFEELRDRQAELRVTFDNMGDGVAMFDAGLRLASWNRNFQELLDVPDEFLASRPLLDDYVRLLVERGELGNRDPDKEVARYRDRAPRQWSVERTRPDGRVLEVRNNPVPGGGAVLIYSDITKRKQAEAEIRTARDAAEAALERQTATAEVLQVINSSPGDLAPVFDAMLEKATRLCDAKFSNLLLYDGQAFTAVADRNLPLAYAQAIGAGPIRPGPNTALGRTIQTKGPVHVTDMLEDVAYGEGDPLRTSTVELGGVRSMVAIPLVKDDDLVGAFAIYRSEAGGFTENQIALVATFAAQAVIAIQNARLITETREALEQQTATADILRVISRSPTDVHPVLEAVASAARRYCGASDVIVTLREGDTMRVATHDGPLPVRLGEIGPLDRTRISS